jgi:FkbM family methyltransferase
MGERPFEPDRTDMRLQDGVVEIWQRVPLSWRTSFAKSRLAPPLRRLMNSLYPTGPGIFQLAAPLDGYKMRLEWRSSKAFVFGTYEREVISALLGIVQPDWVVVDIGAHVGYFALLLAKLVGPRGKVIAFEPLPENFRVLNENVRMNGCGNIVLENRAVAATSGPTSLRSNDSNRLTYTASLVHGHPIVDVEAVSLDDYTSELQERIHLVMMDVEGGEAAVLQGMRSVLHRHLPTVLVELHGFDQTGKSHPALQELHSLDYSIQYLEAPGSQVHILAQPLKAPTDSRRVLD